MVCRPSLSEKVFLEKIPQKIISKSWANLFCIELIDVVFRLFRKTGLVVNISSDAGSCSLFVCFWRCCRLSRARVWVTLHHDRKEHRGVGGIFFDDLERIGEGDTETDKVVYV